MATVTTTTYTDGHNAPINFRGTGRAMDNSAVLYIHQDIVSSIPTATLFSSLGATTTWVNKCSWAIGGSGVVPSNCRLSFVVDDSSNIHVVYLNWATSNPSLSYIKLTNTAGVYTAGTAINLHSAVASRSILGFDIDLIGAGGTQYPVIQLTYQSSGSATQPVVEYQIVKSTTMTSLYTQTDTVANVQFKSFISGCKALESDGHSAYFVTCRFSTTGTATLDGTTMETVLVLVNTSTPAVTSQTRIDWQPSISGKTPDQIQIFNTAAREMVVIATVFGSATIGVSRFSYANNLTPAITKSYTPQLGTIPGKTVEAGSPLKCAAINANLIAVFFFQTSGAGGAQFYVWNVVTLGSAPSFATSVTGVINAIAGSPSHGGGTIAYAGPYDVNVGSNRNIDIPLAGFADIILWSSVTKGASF